MDEGVGYLPSIDYDEVNPFYIEKDYVDHRQVYVGLHHRSGEKLNSRKKQPKLSTSRPPKAVRWENGRKSFVTKENESSGAEVSGDHVPHTVPASERVKFILDGEEEKPPQETPQLFTELEELFVYLDGNTEWKETARWYKYEEDVEEGGDRWSKPHVATLSLYSLFELRSSLMAGTVALDMEATTLDEIADNVLDSLISCNKLDKDFRHKVRETLLCKHRHHRDAGFRRNLSNIINRKSTNSLHNISSAKINSKNTVNHHSNGGGSSCNGLTPSTPNDTTGGADVNDLTPMKMFRNYSQPAFPTSVKPHVSFGRSISQNQNQPQAGHLTYPSSAHISDDEGVENKTPAFLKRLPANAEASNILVGEVDFLDKPITAFVRLSSSCVIGDLTEVPIPTRFVFVMLGPAVSHGRYHEIGRAISTLMADDVFHDVVYRAKSRDDLIVGIDEFLEQVTVLPPGEWDPSIRLDPRLHSHAKVSRRVAMESKLEPAIEHGDGVSEGDDSSESEKSTSIRITKRAFGGVMRDFQVWKNRKHDIRDGINLKCFGSVFFIYLLLIAVIATIGEHNLLSSGGFLGTREHLLSLSVTGILFSIFGGQPLLVIGLELPLSIFDGFLYTICQKYDVDFLPFRMWIGVWAVVLLLVIVTLDFSQLLRYITRFTLEIFVVVAPLVLFMYGFVHMCQMVKAYADLPGTFVSQTCLCVEMNDISGVNGTLKPTTLATTLKAATDTTTTLLPSLSISNTSTILNNTLNSIVENVTLTTVTATSTMTAETLTATVNMKAATTTTVGAVKSEPSEVFHDIHFRDCVANNWQLRGTACNHGVYPFTSILTVSTIVLVTLLTSFQHLGYLPRQVNQFFHNYAALIVVLLLSAAANQFNINIKYLQLPKSLNPDGIHRTSWMVSPFGRNETWTIILALIPAFLLALLTFVEQILVGCYISHNNKVLKKGHGYHFDMLVIAFGVLLASLLGLPFCVSSIFISIIHVHSLTEKGRVDDFIGCAMTINEQRLTSFLVYVLIILTPSMRTILMYIPFPVLYGLLIFALFRTFSGIQFVKRFTLLFMPKLKRPDIVYLRQVPLITVNVFTMVQIIITILLCAIRGTFATIVFPIMMILVIFVRMLLGRILQLSDVVAMDESLPPIKFPWRSCRSKTKNVEALEQGVLLGDYSHEDVLPDLSKDFDNRVNISEELSKTATWKQLTYAEHFNATTPTSTNSPNNEYAADGGKKRRKKRSRGSIQRDMSSLSRKHSTTPLQGDSEFINMKPVGDVDDKIDSSVKQIPNFDDYDADSSPEFKQETTRETSYSRPPSSRKTSEERGSIKRQRSKDRGDLVKRNSSKERNSTKRHEQKDRNPMKKQSSYDRKHKVPKPILVEDTPLPPWEQPYHSPPRKDLGLLHDRFDPLYGPDEMSNSGTGDILSNDINFDDTNIPTIGIEVPSKNNSPVVRRNTDIMSDENSESQNLRVEDGL